MSLSPTLTASTAPFVDLAAPDGARARVYLDGAQVASWVPAGSHDDRLFVSERALYGPGQSLRGGIPICFPQFGSFGALRQHGFARNCRWSVKAHTTDDEGARVVLQLGDSAETRALWPHAFRAELSVYVSGATLSVDLTITNTQDRATAHAGTPDVPCTFTVALHPYFRVQNAFATSVVGLGGTRYRDALREGALFEETRDPLPIDGPLDRIFYDTGDTLDMVEPHRTLRIEKRGFPDAVVWNPGAAGTSSRADFLPGDEHQMLCVEAGAIGTPVVLAAGEQWTGTQVMTAISSAAPPVS
jgi:glucose-6-phosphate 1-epimerase